MAEANRSHFVTGPPTSILSVCLLVILSSVHANSEVSSITAIKGLKVAHHTLAERPTGCTVVLTKTGAVAAVDILGSSPGTRETALLDPTNTVQHVHGIVLAGGSAFGLAAADGVMRYLEERDVGYETQAVKIPIVPAAILYDLDVGDDPSGRPTAECGYRSAQNATDGPVTEGSVGAGTGATVGKLGGAQRAMKRGLGTVAIELPGGLLVAPLIAVNAVGNVHNPDTGAIIAEVRTPDGLAFANAQTMLQGLNTEKQRHINTTIGVVATNASLNKAQLTIAARMVHDGLARAVHTSHTPSDGNAIFAVSTDQIRSSVSLLQIGSAAANVTSEAIVRGVLAATSLPGYPSARDFQGGVR